MDHQTQLLENILPWFTPSQYIRMKEYGHNNSYKEVQVTLQSVAPNIETDIGENERRIIQSELSFMIKGYFYRDRGTAIGPIFKTITDFVIDDATTESVIVSGNCTSGEVDFDVDIIPA